MTTKKDESGFINENVNPNIASLLSDGEKLQKNRSMTKAGRKALIREKKKSDARKGKRALYDLPEGMRENVEEIAKANGTSNSQIAKLAIWMFFKAVRDGKVNVKDFRVPASKNPQYEYVIELPDS